MSEETLKGCSCSWRLESHEQESTPKFPSAGRVSANVRMIVDFQVCLGQMSGTGIYNVCFMDANPVISCRYITDIFSQTAHCSLSAASSWRIDSRLATRYRLLGQV